MSTPPSFADFQALRLTVGTIVRAEPNTGARDPALKLWIDLGPHGTVQSSAQLADREVVDLVGTQVVVVAGFAPLRVGGFRSDVLVVGALTPDGIALLRTERPVPDGSAVA